jgi:glc operon protein GlcG
VKPTPKFGPCHGNTGAGWCLNLKFVGAEKLRNRGLEPYGEPINLETAKKVAAAAIAETAKRNWNALCVSIVNPSGELVYFEKQDNCQYASIAISQHKACTAARYRRPTLVFETLIGKGPYFAYLTTLDDVVASRGGNPLVVGGKVIGAIGVSGGSGAQDNVVSLAGQAALK